MASDFQTYAEAWESSPLAILTLDEEGVIHSVNPAAELIFSMQATQLQGILLTQLTHRLDRGALQSRLDEVRSGRVPNRQEIRFETARRGEFVTGLSLAPTAEHPRRSISVLRDLSKEKAFRPQLLHTERMATMGSIASVVAHELNNALAGAMGCLDVAKRESSDFDDLMNTVKGELVRASDLVKDLKEYARVDDGLSDHVDIAKLCTRIERLHRFHPSDVALTVEVADGLPKLRGNSNQLIQALLNLVRNAEHAAAVAGCADQPQVHMTAALQADVIHLDVTDHGVGVPEKMRASIFDPFYSTKPAGEGTGLGLTVVQAVAVAHGGRIEVHDTPGGGATFRMVLPCQEVSAPPAVAVQADVDIDLAGVRLLVAEDEEAIRRFLRRAFRRWEVEAIVVEDATQAIDAAHHGDFDAVLLDLRMPGGGGVEAYRRIRDMRPQLARRTVFMTGELSMEMSEIVGQEYAGVVQKPFKTEELMWAIQEAVR